MGELKKLGGNEYEYTIRDWGGGLTAYGPQALTRIGRPDEIDTFYEFQNLDSMSGRLEPVHGDTAYNATSFTGTGAEIGDIDFMFPYIRQDSNGLQLLVGSGGQLFEHPTSGASTTVTTLVTLTSSGEDRYGAQALGYCYISGASLTLLRYCHANPGSLGKLSWAGTKSPTNAPTMALVSATAFQTTNTVYKYRYAWEYGTGRELGMGWKESSTSITFLGAANGISVTMDANPPSNYAHATSRALFRNVTSLTTTFFLITRTAYSGSSLATSFLDTVSDATIELGEETDPVVGETITAPVYFEAIPPRMTYVAVHEGRLWGLDIVVDGTRYPHRVMYSRVAGLASHFDQFEASATIQAIDASAGLPTGLVSWMGNLYALFERGISVLSTDPAPGRFPAFSQIVYGRGCIQPKTVSATTDGIVMLSSEGMMLFNGSPNTVKFSEKIWNLIRAYASTPVGGYEPLYRQYTLATTASFTFSHNFESARWVRGLDTPTWNYCCQAGNDLVYGTTQGGGYAAKVYKRKRGNLGASLAGTATQRYLIQHITDFGINGIKHMRDFVLEFRSVVTPTALTDAVNFAFYADNGVSNVNFKLPASGGTQFRGVFDPSQSSFDKFNWSLELPAGDSATSVSMIDSMTFRFTVEPDTKRVVSI